LAPWRYYTLFVVAHAALAGLGLNLLARRLGISAAGALLAGALWMAAGPMLSLTESGVQLAGGALKPWAMLAAVAAGQGGRRSAALAWGACQAAQVLCGALETSLMTAAMIAGYALVLTGGTLRERAGRFVRTAIVAALVAAGLSAAQWLPSLEVASRSAR